MMSSTFADMDLVVRYFDSKPYIACLFHCTFQWFDRSPVVRRNAWWKSVTSERRLIGFIPDGERTYRPQVGKCMWLLLVKNSKLLQTLCNEGAPVKWVTQGTPFWSR